MKKPTPIETTCRECTRKFTYIGVTICRDTACMSRRRRARLTPEELSFLRDPTVNYLVYSMLSLLGGVPSAVLRVEIPKEKDNT